MKSNLMEFPDWEQVKLEAVSIKFVSGGTPSTTETRYWNGEIHWMRSAHISGKEVFFGEKYITQTGLENSATNIVSKDNMLIATRVSLGSVVINRVDMAISQDLTGIILNKERINEEFLYYLLIAEKNVILSKAQGTTIKGILRDDLKKIRISLPPIVEQWGIAEVLGTVDKAIQQTDAVVERAEELKRGLMQHLLTRGIGHTEFKDTPLGEIPETWNIMEIQDISIITGGSTPSTTNSDYWGGDIPFVTPSDITSLENENYISKTRRNITKKGLDSTSSSLLNPPTILLTSRATLGEAAINSVPVSTNQGFANINPHSNVDVLWLLYYLRWKKREFERLASGSTFKEVSKRSIKRMKVTLPPLEEQTRISKMLLSIQDKMKSESEKTRSLRLIKQGLMQLLLSGQIRVELRADGLHRIRDGREAHH